MAASIIITIVIIKETNFVFLLEKCVLTNKNVRVKWTNRNHKLLFVRTTFRRLSSFFLIQEASGGLLQR